MSSADSSNTPLGATGIAHGMSGSFDPARYDGRMPYRRSGRTGLLLPVLIGASMVEQIEEDVGALKHLDVTPDELARIDALTKG